MTIGLGLIIGVLAGTTVGLVCAPQPGRETRATIRRRTSECLGALRGRPNGGRVTGDPLGPGDSPREAAD